MLFVELSIVTLPPRRLLELRENRHRIALVSMGRKQRVNLV